MLAHTVVGTYFPTENKLNSVLHYLCTTSGLNFLFEENDNRKLINEKGKQEERTIYQTHFQYLKKSLVHGHNVVRSIQ